MKYLSVACGARYERQYYRSTAGHKGHLAKLFREQAHDQYDHAVRTRDSLIDHIMRDHGPRGSHKVLTPRALADVREAVSNVESLAGA